MCCQLSVWLSCWQLDVGLAKGKLVGRLARSPGKETLRGMLTKQNQDDHKRPTNNLKV